MVENLIGRVGDRLLAGDKLPKEIQLIPDRIGGLKVTKGDSGVTLGVVGENPEPKISIHVFRAWDENEAFPNWLRKPFGHFLH